MKTKILLLSLLLMNVLTIYLHSQNTLSISGYAFSLADTAGSKAVISITSNTSYTVTHSNTSIWFLVNNYSGISGTWSGNRDLTLTAYDNPNTFARVDTLTFTVTGLPAQKVVVTQEAKVYTLSVSPNALNVGAALGSTASFTITSNTTWTGTHSDESWLLLNNCYGTVSYIGNYTFNLYAYENSGNSVRIDTLTFTVPGLPAQKVVVTQAAADPTLSVSSNELYVSSAENSTTSFYIFSNALWKITGDTSWITPNNSSGTGNKHITLKASANPKITTRAATITISVNGVDSQTIVITQSAGQATLKVFNDTLIFNSLNGSIDTCSISSNTSWNITSNADWLSSTISSGFGDTTFSIIVEANPDTISRIAKITVSASGASSQTIVVIQDKWTAVLLVSTDTLYMNELEDTVSFNILSNLSWTLSSSVSTWLSIDKKAGTGNSTITLSASANKKSSSRTAIITVSDIGNISKKVVITQSGSSTATENLCEIENLIYPNPVKDQLTISIAYDFPAIISIYNMNGEKLLHKQTKTSITTMDLSGFKEGTYIIQIITPDNKFEKMFLKL